MTTPRNRYWMCLSLLLAGVLVACGGADRASRITIDGWAEVLQVEVATSRGSKFPERLADIDPTMRSHLSPTDAWGKELGYVRLRSDLYLLVSAGPDGSFGNDDDIVAVNGHFRDTMKSYEEHPRARKALSG